MIRQRLARFRLMLIVLFALALPVPPLFAQGAASERFQPDQLVVKLYRAADLGAITAKYPLSPTPISQFGTNPIYCLQITNGTSPLRLAAMLARDERVVYAEPNYINHIPEDQVRSGWSTGFQDDTYQSQWAETAMRLDEAHMMSRGQGVRVAVLDTGVDMTHAALQGRVSGGYDFVDLDNDPSEEPGDTMGAYGHGTHVAGLILLAAPEATIMPVRVLDSKGKGNIWVLAEALRYAVDPDGNPTTDDGASIINLSLSTPSRSRMIEDVLGKVTCYKPKTQSRICRRDVLVVAAAGNSGNNTREYPAAFELPSLIAVGASTPENTLASFSTNGPWIDVAAPGESIWSTIPGGFAPWSGTSMSAPLVAGEAALLRAVAPELSAREIAARITASAAPMRNRFFGRADAATALARIK